MCFNQTQRHPVPDRAFHRSSNMMPFLPITWETELARLLLTCLEAWLYREVTQGRTQDQEFPGNSRKSSCREDVNSFSSLAMALPASLFVIRRSISLMEDSHSIRVLRTPPPCDLLESCSSSQRPSFPPWHTVPLLFRAFSQGLTHSRYRINASLPMM